MEKIRRRSRATGCWLAISVQASFFDVPLRLVDQLVAGDELFGQFFVVLGQRLHRLLLQLVDHRRQVDELLFDLSELQIEVLASHVDAPSQSQSWGRAHYSILWARGEVMLR